MRNPLLSLTLAGVFGVFLTTGEAQACHKKACTPACAPVVAAPVPPPVVTCAPPKAKCGGMKIKMPKMGGLCHKKAAPACAPVPVAYAAPATYAAPVYAAPQASAQASGQGS